MVMNGPKFSDVLVSYITFSQAALSYPLLLHSKSKTFVKNVASLVEGELAEMRVRTCSDGPFGVWFRPFLS
jgi:hypothetical protein